MHFNSFGSGLNFTASLIFILGLASITSIAALPVSGSEVDPRSQPSLVRRAKTKLRARIVLGSTYTEEAVEQDEWIKSSPLLEKIHAHIIEEVKGKATKIFGENQFTLHISFSSMLPPKFKNDEFDFNVQWGNRAVENCRKAKLKYVRNQQALYHPIAVSHTAKTPFDPTANPFEPFDPKKAPDFSYKLEVVWTTDLLKNEVSKKV
ncbi:hypothetical protein J3R30DRAFT_3403258 [Lentinula aciculospora]|uniref:Uncharacterized protein n=1 Tax=Lentinula aciculospora TaxID=153920 RepID=A0A9W9DQ32_9AGAR|nr:hypothetical protein J3R30DRAFT_3403258 [Lentinula aciculospora]